MFCFLHRFTRSFCACFSFVFVSDLLYCFWHTIGTLLILKADVCGDGLANVFVSICSTKLSQKGIRECITLADTSILFRRVFFREYPWIILVEFSARWVFRVTLLVPFCYIFDTLLFFLQPSLYSAFYYECFFPEKGPVELFNVKSKLKMLTLVALDNFYQFWQS